ncbi:ABC transporter ATP-binding protein [Uliginosibacterium aquaticum]|uniref:ABC transporter ATP-binding protein n=1 Tax=Uliginosibacterium aquaticum TaxID=2731212 RepID=A0ABX2IEE7_9RHOO|nr:ABC transporter ATP-binding protein [Uliginosibacterium aquaticum]NSL54752.1 ABC transporter ATP-binding protein [Uliginosibacterium aquaticum]
MPIDTHLPSIPSRNPFRFVADSMLFFLAEDRRSYLTHMPLVLVTETGELLQPFLNGVLISWLMAHQPGESLLPLSLLILALASSRGVIAWFRLRSKRILGQLALNCRYRARVWGFERLVGFSMHWHHQESSGNKVQRLITGADAVRDWGNFHNEIAAPLSSMLGVVVACAFISPYFILFVAYFVAGMFLIEHVYDKKIARLSHQINSGHEHACAALVEGASSMLTIKASGAGDMVNQVLAGKEARARSLGHQRVALNASKAMSFHVHTGLAFGVFLTALSWAALREVIAIGFIVTYIQYFNSLRASTNAFTDRFQAMLERYAELTRLMPLFASQRAEPARLALFPADWQQLEVCQLSYCWGDKPALRDISFTLARGERIGITGASGSGKSSLIKLILGLYEPASGSIELDALPLAAICQDELEQYVAVVLQDVELFNVSLRDNITLLREPDPALLARVCAAADLGGLLSRLPQAWDTPLGERGHTLSGGERQRVGIARALYRQPAILILDEATSALDDATEDRVMRGILASLPAEASLLAIAHRTRSLRGMARILHLEHGALMSDERRPFGAAVSEAGSKLTAQTLPG